MDILWRSALIPLTQQHSKCERRHLPLSTHVIFV